MGEIQLKLLTGRKYLLFLAIAVLTLSKSGAQSFNFTSDAIQIVSSDWRKDSTSCLGLRIKVCNLILKSEPDSLSKDELFKSLGKPNVIEKFYSGVTRRKYVEYIYYIYKDQCPKISVEGYAIGFVFDEGEINLIEIVDHDYCG